MEPILKSHFNGFKKSFEIETGGIVEKESAAFEKFINYVLFSRDYPDIFIADVELLDFVSVGGSNDTGIDGIGIRVNGRLVHNKEEVNEIVQSNRKIEVEFVFIQSKMRSNLEVSEFNAFGTGVKNFFSDGYLPENENIREMREIKDHVYNDEKVISKLNGNPNIYLYYVGTGNEPTDDNFIGARELLTSELTNNSHFELALIKIIGGKQIIKFCRELENKFEVQLNIIDIFPLIVDSKDDVKKSYAFTCTAKELFKVLVKEDGQIRRALFNDNVRDYLGNKGSVNSEIEGTIVNDPEMFLLCNNGITIVCADFVQIRDKLVKIENPQIVNGCQTSNSIFNFRDHPNVEKLQILVRLISTENISVTNKIVRGTNKQNQVLDEAFEATLPFHQDTLEPFFLAFDSNTKIYYERRTKQYNNDPLIKKTQIVNLRILTQSFVAMFLDAPHDSHRHEAKLLETYAKDKDSRKIFSEEHGAYPYYICSLTWYMFEKYFREERIDNKYKPYRSHFYLIFKYCVGDFQPKLVKSKPLDSYCLKLLGMLTDDVLFDENQKLCQRIFDGAVDVWTVSKSKYGIKDNKEFTDLLIEQCRKFLVKKEMPVATKNEPIKYSGSILRMIWNEGKWFCFINRGGDYENVYFDNRDYVGDARDLLPNTAVNFEIVDTPKGKRAKNVILAKRQRLT